MAVTKVAKLFKNGASQAVRLPAEFRFSGTQIYATRDERTGDVTLSEKPGAAHWAEFFRLRDSMLDEIPEDFMAERPMNQLPVERDIFGGEK